MAGKGDTYRPVAKSVWDSNYSNIRGFQGYVESGEDPATAEPNDREDNSERPVDVSER